jgi:hypothetical protein
MMVFKYGSNSVRPHWKSLMIFKRNKKQQSDKAMATTHTTDVTYIENSQRLVRHGLLLLVSTFSAGLLIPFSSYPDIGKSTHVLLILHAFLLMAVAFATYIHKAQDRITNLMSVWLIISCYIVFGVSLPNQNMGINIDLSCRPHSSCNIYFRILMAFTLVVETSIPVCLAIILFWLPLRKEKV